MCFQLAGDYYADLLVNESLIHELKAVQSLTKECEIQLVNYLTTSEMDGGLRNNFSARSS
ncbi:MAG: GxxExxY protein [Candidatus Kryptoniota bacterium]